MSALRKKLLELWDNGVRHLIDEFGEDSVDALTRYWPTVAECYMQNELQVWIRLRARFGVMNDGHWLAVFERSPLPVRARRGRWTQQVGTSEGSYPRDYSSKDNDEFTMFVNIVEVPDESEASTRVRSTVRLYDLQDLPDLFTDARADEWQTLLVGEQPRTSRPTQDRELRTTIGGVPADANELVGKVVERGPEVVNAIANDCAPLGIGSRRMVCAINVAKALVINICGNEIQVSWEDSREFALQEIEVEPRSLTFDHDAVKRGWLPPPLPARAHDGNA